MAKYEVEYTLTQKIVFSANSPEEAKEKAQNIVSNAIVIINSEIVAGSLHSEVLEVREKEETALSILLDKIRQNRRK
jgi:hypothetical protein